MKREDFDLELELRGHRMHVFGEWEPTRRGRGGWIQGHIIHALGWDEYDDDIPLTDVELQLILEELEEETCSN